MVQDISQQVAGYMRDPSKMIKGMQQSRSAVALFGTVSLTFWVDLRTAMFLNVYDNFFFCFP